MTKLHVYRRDTFMPMGGVAAIYRVSGSIEARTFAEIWATRKGVLLRGDAPILTTPEEIACFISILEKARLHYEYLKEKGEGTLPLPEAAVSAQTGSRAVKCIGVYNNVVSEAQADAGCGSPI